jgi:hypothetical protein
MKVKDAISRIMKGLNISTVDDRLSRRYLFSVLKNVATTFISRKLNELKLQKDYNLYSLIEVKLEKIDVVKSDVIEFRTCNTVMKSVNPIKNLVFYNGGGSINLVTNLDRTVTIEKIDLRQFARNKKRAFYNDKKPFYYVDGEGYLYIINSDIELVLASVLLVGVDESDCKKLALEQDINIPSKLEYDIFTTVINEIAGVTKRIPKDENSNLDSRT